MVKEIKKIVFLREYDNLIVELINNECAIIQTVISVSESLYTAGSAIYYETSNVCITLQCGAFAQVLYHFGYPNSLVRTLRTRKSLFPLAKIEPSFISHLVA